MAPPTTSTGPTSNALISGPRVRFMCALIYLSAFAIYFLAQVVSGVNLLPLYRTAMFASIFNELLTLKLSVPMFTMSPETLNLISGSPVLPRLLLSLFLWLNSSTCLLQMIPMAINYCYQALDYIPTDQTILKNRYWITYGRSFAEILTPKRMKLINYAVHTEILTLVYILISVIRMKESLIHLLVHTQYLIAQYILSPNSTQAILFWDSVISRLLKDPRCPGIVKTGDIKLREYLAKLVAFTSKFLKPPKPAAPLHKR